jgi:heptaprenyl diphosphate synthase
MNTKRLTSLAIFLSISIVLSILESFIPSFSVPGAKLGMANIVTLVVMYMYGEKDAFLILVLRIILVGLLRGSIFAYPFWLSVSGGMLAFSLMYTFKKLKVFNMVSISVMGSLGHSLGQILMAMFLLDTAELAFYFPLLFLIAIPTGIFVGAVSQRFLLIARQAFEVEDDELFE